MSWNILLSQIYELDLQNICGIFKFLTTPSHFHSLILEPSLFHYYQKHHVDTVVNSKYFSTFLEVNKIFPAESKTMVCISEWELERKIFMKQSSQIKSISQ
jgi:hypothetical protein